MPGLAHLRKYFPQNSYLAGRLLRTEMTTASANLAEMAACFISLKESRRTLRGPCPFHPDAGESFMISPEKNIFKCFGCGREGGPIEFRLAIERLQAGGATAQKTG